ncbi:hypothetical protein [Embleya sp. NPDC001921]
MTLRGRLGEIAVLTALAAVGTAAAAGSAHADPAPQPPTTAGEVPGAAAGAFADAVTTGGLPIGGVQTGQLPLDELPTLG